MKNLGYEYEIFNHFFGFLILKLVELDHKDTPFIFFYRLRMHAWTYFFNMHTCANIFINSERAINLQSNGI